jgi:predicted 2-oxoglutarate/Fe(II)-dependent dioxygenase YbiX
MKINLRVTFNDKTEQQVTATARDLVAFEDKFTKSVTSLESNFRVTDILWIAWHWLKRTDATQLDFDEWCDTVDEIEASDTDPK